MVGLLGKHHSYMKLLGLFWTPLIHLFWICWFSKGLWSTECSLTWTCHVFFQVGISRIMRCCFNNQPVSDLSDFSVIWYILTMEHWPYATISRIYRYWLNLINIVIIGYYRYLWFNHVESISLHVGINGTDPYSLFLWGTPEDTGSAGGPAWVPIQSVAPVYDTANNLVDTSNKYGLWYL